MAAIVHSDKAKKAIKKIKEAMQDYPLGIEFGELMQKTGYAKSSLYNALSLVGAYKSDDGLWHLPGSQNVIAPVNEVAEDDIDDDLDDLATAIEQPVTQDDGGNIQDDGGNMQDDELSTQAPQVSSPNSYDILVDNDDILVDNDDNLVDIDTDANQSSTSQAKVFWSNEKVYCPMLSGEIFKLEINTGTSAEIYPLILDGYMFSRDGRFNNNGAVMLYHATKENRQMLSQKYPELKFELPKLVGSDLMLKILEEDEVWLCQVGDDGDENCTNSDIRLVTGYTEGQGFRTLGFGSLSFKNAVPVNVHGQPISESDVFGVA